MKTFRAAACVAAMLLTGSAMAQTDDAGAALRARFAALRGALGANAFHRPLHLASSERPDGVSGEIHAVVGHPFASIRAALVKPSQWCDILILHLNTKYCRPSIQGPGTVLRVVIGKKFDQPMADAYRVDFVFRVAASAANHLRVNLDAKEGPLGTRDYRVVLEATASPDGRTLMRLSYTYAFGAAGRLAMKAYLGTVASSKVGFTVVGKDAAGEPRYVDGMRGLVERNTMRYYLAIEAFLGASGARPQERLDKSLRGWFAASETFPRQLHEMERGDYLAMKRKEHARQQSDL